jgi:hypothetical protein
LKKKLLLCNAIDDVRSKLRGRNAPPGVTTNGQTEGVMAVVQPEGGHYVESSYNWNVHFHRLVLLVNYFFHQCRSRHFHYKPFCVVRRETCTLVP